jgi:transposase
VAPSTVVKWMRRWRETGSVAPQRQGEYRRSRPIEAHAEEILDLVAARPDITLKEIVAHLASVHGKSFAPSTVWRLLDRHRITFKKTAHASEQERPDVVAARQAWRAAQPDLDPGRLVFVDETGASTKMARLYRRRCGYSGKARTHLRGFLLRHGRI